MNGMDGRQVAMMMRKMGIEVRDIEDVREVVIRTREHEYRFTNPSVSVMKAQGSETWQVQGKPKATELAPQPKGTQTNPHPAPAAQAAPPEPVAIPEGDVRMVMEQTGKDFATAKKALESTGGDLAEAIVRLGSDNH